MPSKRPSTEQCTVVDLETQRRCRRNGTGHPPLCQAHRDLLKVPSPTASPLFEMAAAWIRGERPPRRAFEDAFVQMAERIAGRPLTKEELHAIRSGATMDFGGGQTSGSSPSSGPSASSSGPRRPPPDPASSAQSPAAIRARAIGRARRTLGFTAKEPITQEQLKTRFRELARKWHPDRNPDKASALTKMQEINVAMDLLSNPA